MMPRPIYALLALALLALFTFAACDGDDDDDGGDAGNGASEDRLNVLSTVSPITSIVENIGGTRIELHGLIPEGVNSHTYEPPVSDAAKIADADLIILNGLQLEEPTLELAEANKKDDAVILTLGDETISPAEYKYDFSFPESGGKPNPHLWPNPALTQEYADLIHEALVDADPDNKSYYDANHDALTANLTALDEAMATATATVPEDSRRLLTYHDSWAYWAERYGFTVIGAIQPSDFAEPSASEVADLIDQVRDENVPAVFGSEVFPSPVLEQIADEGGAEYVDDLRDDDLPGEPGDELHSYIGLMVQNMRIMLPALGGDASALDAVDAALVFDDGAGEADYPQ
jgi:ABC-type Zn uptake system ZnuABC Zn-binding protein ZnuA